MKLHVKIACFLMITAEHQDCPFFAVSITIKTSSQNISITLSEISPKLHKHWGGYWRKRLLWMILEEQFPLLRNTAKSKKVKVAFCCCDNSNVIATLIIKNFHLYLIQLWWQIPDLCLWRLSLCSKVGGIALEKLCQATLIYWGWPLERAA